MKKKSLLLLFAIPMVGAAQDRASEEIHKAFAFPDARSTLYIYVENIQGFVNIEGYGGSEVVVDVQKTINGKSKEDVAIGMGEMELGIWQHGDSLAVYMKNNKYTQFEIRGGRVCYNYMNCRGGCFDRDRGYDATFTFTVKVPAGSRLTAGTVNKGDVSIKGISGLITARNVNGHINISQAHQVDYATTVNGDINIVYGTPGRAGGEFKTINGDINLDFRQEPDAELSFKTMNGSLYTNVEQVAFLKPEVTKLQGQEKESTIYKIEKITPLRLGKGGTRMTFETLNGDVTIRKAL